MTSTTSTDTPSWPTAPGEDPTGTLPRLVCELHPGTPATGTGRRAEPARHPWARVLINTTRVIQTGNPDRLRHDAGRLLELADALQHAHDTFNPHPDQLDLNGSA